MKRLILLFLIAGAVGAAGAADLTAEWRRQYADLQKELGRRAYGTPTMSRSPKAMPP